MELTEVQLMIFYDGLYQEQMRLMQDIKSQKDPDSDRKNHQQIEIITGLMRNLLKLKNLKKKF